MPCIGIRDEIERRLRKNVRNSLFPEFLPILATKLDDPAWVGRLAAWGEGPASTDCNGGLILGLALLDGRDEFVRALWNPRWEACVPEPAETCLELCDALVLPRLSSDERLSSDLHQLDRDLAQAATHELELQYFTPAS